MASGDTSPRLAEVLSLEGLIVRSDLQQDKQAALLAVVSMFDEFQVPYVVTGGLAVQLYSDQPRNTMDVDIVSLRRPFKSLQEAQPWSRYGLVLVFDRRRYVKLRHESSNVDIDINLDTRFARLLEEPRFEQLAGRRIGFTSAFQIAFAKLRTQRSDWPRDPAKRLQDRADLIRIFRNTPSLPEQLRADTMVTPEMRQILDDICHDLGSPSSDDLPPEEGDAEAT